jgi:DNA invertase Pin-like site-specific DNA recombinase
MMIILQAFSQFERDLIVERTKEGLVSTRARGRKDGRP